MDGAYPSSTFSGFASFERVESQTVRLGYPSAYAVTNGLVSRIRVFAAYGYTERPGLGIGGTWGWQPDLVYARGFHAGGLPLGGLPRLSLCDESGVVKEGGPDGHYEDNYSAFRGFRGITLNKVYEVSNPSSVSNLTFTFSLPLMTPLNPGAENIYVRLPPNSIGNIQSSRGLDFYTEVFCFAYVTVVDWDWGH